MLLAVLLGTLGSASVASANLKQEFEAFSDCPLNTPGVVNCSVAHTTSGEFKLGSKTVPIVNPVLLQGGLIGTETECCTLAPAADGNTLSHSPQPVPGGLLGIAELGNLTEVFSTAELAGTVHLEPGALFSELGTGTELPVKAKLENPLLGESCYIGSDSEPMVFKLTTGTTSPPPPNEPLSGTRGKVVTRGEGLIAGFVGASLVDNSFAAPGVNGCGGVLAPVVDPSVDSQTGLPAAAGHNTAILNGTLEQTTSRAVKAILPLPDVGRCEKVTPIKEGRKLVFRGQYKESTCFRETENELEGEPPNGHYEWVAGPGPKAKFTGTLGALTLEAVGGAKVTCTAGHEQGEYTGTTTQSASVTLSGCSGVVTGSAVSCQTSGASAGEITTAQLSGGLEFVSETIALKPIVGVDLKPASGPVASFECGGKPVTVGGSVIAPYAAVDKMGTEMKLKLKATKGLQAPERFEGGAKDTLTSNQAGSEEQAGLTTTDVITNEEPLEIKGAVVVG
jgi:hypothetical protein